jgi:hypothetical protein
VVPFIQYHCLNPANCIGIFYQKLSIYGVNPSYPPPPWSCQIQDLILERPNPVPTHRLDPSLH